MFQVSGGELADVRGLQKVMCEGGEGCSCMGYSHDIFKFLERAANVKFLCNGCLHADIHPKSTVDCASRSYLEV